MQGGLLVIGASLFKNMAEEEAGNHLFFCIIFLQRNFVNFLISIAWYFPKLSIFFDGLQPSSLHYLFLERFEQANVPLLLFSNLVQEADYPKGRETLSI